LKKRPRNATEVSTREDVEEEEVEEEESYDN
jgi:hypothetical protein